MHFLRNEFIDQLRADIDETTGNIVIEAAQFTPQEILETDREMFEDEFEKWRERRREQLLEKAEQILSLYDNRDRFCRLQQAYLRDSVLPFVGAGLSIPSGYPGWTEYLYCLREETSVSETDLTCLINSGEYEAAAQLLFDDMSQDSFNEHLENKFDNDKKLEGFVRFLPDYFPQSGIITTNFDNVIDRCYEAAQKSFSEKLLGADARQLLRYLGEGKRVLVRLHGRASSSHKRILTKQEYEQYYVDGKTIESSIEAMATKTLLFLGCSLVSDRNIDCLKSLASTKGRESVVRHYAFLAIGDDKAERLKRKKELTAASIFPIWYPANNDHDECLMALFTKLAENTEGSI